MFKKLPEYKNGPRNVRFDCESSDLYLREQNIADADSIFVFGNEALALEQLSIDCESSDGQTRYDNIEAVEQKTMPEDLNSPAAGYKRYTDIIFQGQKVHA